MKLSRGLNQQIVVTGIAVSLRVFNLFLVKSYYVPDEYWQSLEVAHKIVFGYGYETWEWIQGIRSYIYVLLIVIIYKFLFFLGLDSTWTIIWLPRIFQACLSTVSDCYFFRFVKETSTPLRYKWAFLCWCGSFFVSYCATRNIVNTVEMDLTIISLFYYPWIKSEKERDIYLWFVGLACFLRPTAGVVWLPLVCFWITGDLNPVKRIFRIIFIGAVLAFISIAVDSFFYLSFLFTPWRFAIANIFQNIGAHYGVNGCFWYLLVGIPVVMGVCCIPFYCRIFTLLKTASINNSIKFSPSSIVEIKITATVLWSILIFSFIPHKEFRFLLPILPMMVYISSNQLAIWSEKIKSKLVVGCTVLVLIFNVMVLVILGQYHQVGSLDVMNSLSLTARENEISSNFLFLMPCHSTPLYSHLHVNVTTRFLTCLPNFENEAFYLDEADIFFANPLQWLSKEYPLSSLCDLPSHIILFSGLLTSVEPFLTAFQYKPWKKYFHTAFEFDKHMIYVYNCTKIKPATCTANSDRSR